MTLTDVKCSMSWVIPWLLTLISLFNTTHIFIENTVKEMETSSLDHAAMKYFPYILKNREEYFVNFGSENRSSVANAVYD